VPKVLVGTLKPQHMNAFHLNITLSHSADYYAAVESQRRVNHLLCDLSSKVRLFSSSSLASDGIDCRAG